jgi:hypothetical protein
MATIDDGFVDSGSSPPTSSRIGMTPHDPAATPTTPEICTDNDTNHPCKRKRPSGATNADVSAHTNTHNQGEKL